MNKDQAVDLIQVLAIEKISYLNIEYINEDSEKQNLSWTKNDDE